MYTFGKCVFVHHHDFTVISLSMLMSNQGAARIEKLTDAKLTTGVAAA